MYVYKDREFLVVIIFFLVEVSYNSIIAPCSVRCATFSASKWKSLFNSFGSSFAHKRVHWANPYEYTFYETICNVK